MFAAYTDFMLNNNSILLPALPHLKMSGLSPSVMRFLIYDFVIHLYYRHLDDMICIYASAAKCNRYNLF